VNDHLYLYWHLRQKDCAKIREAVCTETFYITVQYYPACPTTGDKPALRIDKHDEPFAYRGNARTMLNREVDELARMDGFTDAWEMAKVLAKMHPNAIDGNIIFQVIRW
jgi:hypothetical protein